MFPRLAEHYRSVVQDLVMSLQALADGLQSKGISASCYVCGMAVMDTELPSWQISEMPTWFDSSSLTSASAGSNPETDANL